MSRNEIPSKKKLAAWNVLARDWAPYLAPMEQYLLMRLFDASIEWGNWSFEATYKQIAAGRRARDENAHRWRFAPVNISRPSFYRLLDRLKAKEVLFVEAVMATPTRACCTRFTINTNWSPAEGVPSMESEMARTS